MRTKNTFGVQFITRANKARHGEVPIYARLSVDSKRIEISLKYWINPDNWNHEKSLTRGKNEEIRALNTFLAQARSRLTECYQELLLKKKQVTAEAVKNLYCYFQCMPTNC